MPDLRFEPAAPFSQAEISEIERELGRELPNDYCEFIKENGGAFVGGLIDGAADLPILTFFGVDGNKGLLSKLRAYPDLRKDSVLPIAGCELGNLYVITQENTVFYINYYGGKATVRKISNSFQDFLARIVVQDK